MSCPEKPSNTGKRIPYPPPPFTLSKNTFKNGEKKEYKEGERSLVLKNGCRGKPPFLPGVGGTGTLTPLVDPNAVCALKQEPRSPNTGFLQPQFHGRENVLSLQGQEGEEMWNEVPLGELCTPSLQSGGHCPRQGQTRAHQSLCGPHSLIPSPWHSGIMLRSDAGVGKGPGHYSSL